MAYVAIKGGAQALAQAEASLDALRAAQALCPEQGGEAAPLKLADIEQQLRLLTSRLMSEGGLYHPQLAALALKQMQGDTLEAGFALRAYRSTKPRLMTLPVHDSRRMRVMRRISSAFKDIPGGQILGPTFDYTLRLMRMDLAEESPEAFRQWASRFVQQGGGRSEEVPDTFPKVLDALRAQGLLPLAPVQQGQPPFDITREPLRFPAPRSAALATLSRGESGSLLALAYSNMRGYGDVHPTVAELRVGHVPLMLPHPASGEPIEVGEVLMTECEVVAMYEPPEAGAKPVFTLGYGACFGHHETKAICMAILDRSLQRGASFGPSNPSEDAEFVLLHVDGVDAMGFANHYKMPHYVTFQSDMDRLRQTQAKARASEAAQEAQP